MCADAANETYCGDHSVIYTDTESLCCTPEINTMLYGNYTSSKQCPSGRDLDFFLSKTNKQKKLPSRDNLLVLFFLTGPCGMWDLSSQTRDRTSAPALEAESQPLNCQGDPNLLVLREQPRLSICSHVC